jgi:GntR family transcriptional regulator, rspAB operon transcriptional repressor
MSTEKPRAQTLRGSLSEQAYQALRRMILRGELLPGAALSRRVVARELGMSLLPISEAFQRLEHDGLLESWPRVGTRVRVPSQQDVRGNYVIREALESQSARLFTQKASLAEKEEMVQMAAEIDVMHRDMAVSSFDYFSAHEHLHRRIAECTGCPALVDAIEKTNILIRTWQYTAISDYRDDPVHYHQQLMDVLCGGDVEAADRIMREHVRYGISEILRRMEPYFRGEHEPPIRIASGSGRRGLSLDRDQKSKT